MSIMLSLAVWAAFFDDGKQLTALFTAWGSWACPVNAMIFLSPISNFDIFLPEDPSVNSMVGHFKLRWLVWMNTHVLAFQLDSFSLWKQICESRLLSEATFILFLNKMDLLKRKLDAGMRCRVFYSYQNLWLIHDIGIQFSAYVPLYKDQPNSAEAVALCKFVPIRARVS